MYTSQELVETQSHLAGVLELPRQRLNSNQEIQKINNVAFQMVEIWRVHIYEKDNIGYTCHRLSEILGEYFRSDLQEWEKFVLYVTRSKFLMGEARDDFYASLGWIATQENALRVKRGLFHSLEEKRKYRIYKQNIKKQEV